MIEKREIKACCGKKQLILKIDVPFEKVHLSLFAAAGFPYLQQYVDAGMIYVEDKGLTANGIFGSNELRIKCKNQLCSESLQALERILETEIDIRQI